MAGTHHCPNCGAMLPDDAPSGLCPKCLLREGFATDAPIESNPSVSTQPHVGSPASHFTPPSPTELASRLPQLEIQALLGQGGMGAVYKGRQPALDRLVAVKILPPKADADASFGERFAREARAMARLNHPHIVNVYEFGHSQGQYYLVMEFVEGVNLREAIRSGSVTPQAALKIVSQICEALQYAHEEGIVHRDIKPENILLDRRGCVKIADFGLAKLLRTGAETHDLTGTHQVMGTPRYMAPEQLEGSRDVDHRADIYSLGVVFYELLTGEVPMGSFQPPSAKVAVDVHIDEVVLKSLQREPGRRYQHASEVKTDVERCSAERTGAVQPEVASPTSVNNDFVLMNPSLPRVAQWITVYSIVAKPLLWLIIALVGLLSSPWRFAAEGSDFDMTTFATAIYSVIDFVLMIVVVIGGFKLRALLRSGPRWIKVGLAAQVALGVAAMVFSVAQVVGDVRVIRQDDEQAGWRLEIFQMQTEQQPTQEQIDSLLAHGPRPVEGPGIVAGFFGIVLLTLDIAVLVWLWRNSKQLPLHAIPPRTNAVPESTESKGPRLSKLAVASAITTLPSIFLLCFLLTSLAQQGVPELIRLVNAPDFGEVAFTFLFAPIVIGSVLGVAAIHRIRNYNGQLHGTLLAGAATLFFSCLALNTIVILIVAPIASIGLGTSTLSGDELRGAKGLLFIWAILLPIAAIDFCIVRRTWRWLINSD